MAVPPTGSSPPPSPIPQLRAASPSDDDWDPDGFDEKQIAISNAQLNPIPPPQERPELAELTVADLGLRALGAGIWDYGLAPIGNGAVNHILAPLASWGMKKAGAALLEYGSNELQNKASEITTVAQNALIAGGGTVIGTAQALVNSPEVQQSVEQMRDRVVADAKKTWETLSQEDWAEDWGAIQEDKTKIFPILANLCEKVPTSAQIAAVLAFPCNKKIKAILLTALAWKLMKPEHKAPIENMGTQILEWAESQWPESKNLIQQAKGHFPAILKSLKESLNTPVIVSGQNINPIASSAPEDPANYFAQIALEARKTQSSRMTAPPEDLVAKISKGDVAPANNPRPEQEASNAKDRADKHLKKLTEYSRHFTVFWVLQWMGGIKEGNNSTLLGLVHEASKLPEVEKPNLWDLFAAKYPEKTKPLSLSWWKCKFSYWIGYKWTSIIPNVVETYLNAGIRVLQERTGHIGPEQSKDIARVLDWVDHFLQGQLAAVDKYNAPIKSNRTLNDYKRRAIIEETYGPSPETLRKRLAWDQTLRNKLAKRAHQKFEEINNDIDLLSLNDDFALENLCKKYSKNLVDGSAPRVLFFRNKQGEFPGGKIFSKVLWVVLRPLEILSNFGIRTIMRDRILPYTLKSLVQGGLDAAQPHYLPFSLALTQFLTGQLKKLKDKLHSNGDPNPIEPITGSEALPDVVSKLKCLLDSADPNKKNRDDFDGRVQKGIEGGILKGGHILLNFLTDESNREEMFALLFQLCKTPFEGQAPLTKEAWKDQSDKYKAEEKLLKKEAQAVFRKLVNDALTEQFECGNPEKTQTIAQGVFDRLKNGGTETFNGFAQSAQQMKEKIEREPRESILEEAMAFGKTMEAFAEAQRGYLDKEGLTQAAKYGIARTLNPIYKITQTLIGHISVLKDAQLQFDIHNQFVEGLAKTDDLIVKASRLMNESPGDLPRLEDFNTALKPLFDHLKEGTVTQKLRSSIEGLSAGFSAICERQKTPDALSKIEPLIGQLERFPNNNRVLPQISEQLEFLEVDEREIIKRLIHQMKPEDLASSIWDGPEVLKIREKYKNATQKQKQEVLEDLRKFQQFAGELRDAYEKFKGKNCEKMKAEIELAIPVIEELQKQVKDIQMEKQINLTADQLGVVSGIAGFLAGFLGGPALGAGLGAAARVGIDNVNGLASNEREMAIAKIVAAAIAAATGTSVAPDLLNPIPLVGDLAKIANTRIGAGIMAGIGMQHFGSHFMQGTIGAVEEQVTEKIMEIFRTGYKNLVIAPHLAHAAATGIMKALSQPQAG
jgi:hypothetical protein